TCGSGAGRSMGGCTPRSNGWCTRWATPGGCCAAPTSPGCRTPCARTPTTATASSPSGRRRCRRTVSPTRSSRAIGSCACAPPCRPWSACWAIDHHPRHYLRPRFGRVVPSPPGVATETHQVPAPASIGPTTRHVAERTAVSVLVAIAVAHLLNDTIQSVVPALYPLVKDRYALSFTQVGLITLTFQFTASILQPLVGLWTDLRPRPFALVGGMLFTLAGVVLLAQAGSYPALLGSVALVGVGSSIFHPEASRMAYVASGGRRALAQSVFQLEIGRAHV